MQFLSKQKVPSSRNVFRILKLI